MVRCSKSPASDQGFAKLAAFDCMAAIVVGHGVQGLVPLYNSVSFVLVFSFFHFFSENQSPEKPRKSREIPKKNRENSWFGEQSDFFDFCQVFGEKYPGKTENFLGLGGNWQLYTSKSISHNVKLDRLSPA